MFPARAGMSRPIALLVLVLICVPRASGDEPAVAKASEAAGVFPARAGMSRTF